MSTHRWAAQVSSRTGYRAPLSAKATRRVDGVLLHPVWGPLLFLVVVFSVFEVVFSIGQPLSDGLGDVLAKLGTFATNFLPAGWIRSLVLDGAWKGVTSVLVFLPQILLLFLFIGVLEDSGYLAEWKGVHSAALRVCLRSAGDHGYANDREPTRPAGDDSGYALYDLLRAVAGIHAFDRCVYP
jgi:Fe2+ transport system protein B